MNIANKIRAFLVIVVSAVTLMAAADENVPDRLLRLQQQLSADTTNVQLLKDIGYIYLSQGDFDNSIKIGRKLIDIARHTGDRDVAELYGHIFIGGSNDGSNMTQQEAYRHLEQALNIAEQNDDREALVSVYNAFGIYYSTVREDIYLSLYYHFKALDLTRQLGDQRRYAILLSNIAANYARRNDVTGLAYAEEAYESACALQDSAAMFYSAFSLAYLYMLKGDLDKSLSYIHRTEELAQKMGYVDNQGLQSLYASYYLAQGKPELVVRLCEQTLRENPEVSSPDLLLQYSRALRETSRLNESLSAISKAYKEIKSYGAESGYSDIFDEYAQTYKAMGKLDSALYWTERFVEYKDSLMDISQEMALQERRINHEIFQRDRKLDSQRIELLSARSRFIVVVAVVVLLLLVIAGLAFYFYRQRKLYRAIVKQNTDFLQREKYLRGIIARSKQEAEEDRKNEENISGQDKTAEEEKSTSERDDSLMERISKLMIEDKIYTESSLTLASLAERLDTNRTYISNAINRTTGQTFSQMLTHYRITEAIRLISNLEANLPIKQIASDCGFESLSTFYSAFSSVTGLTPARYRAQLIESKA